MWTLQKLKVKEEMGEVCSVLKKNGRRRRRRDHGPSEAEYWSVDERRARLVTRSLHVNNDNNRREWGWPEDERGVGLDEAGRMADGRWVKLGGKAFEDTFENTQWREVKHVHPGAGSDQPGSCWITNALGPDQSGNWVKLGRPPMLSYLSVSTGESWRERADK